MAVLEGYEAASTANNRRQVYYATHKGEETLPFMYRSFISFTYGGKKIEEFDLIATCSGDRMNRPGYASFNDVVSIYDNLDGQHYWATHYTNNQLDFTLSTDGIDQRMLDDFLHWFQAGISRELILAEHPNRAIMARVAEPPRLDLLPFEFNTKMTISDQSIPYNELINNSYDTIYNVKTTLYRGDISLSLTMDQPHWYSISNILGEIKEDQERHAYQFVDEWKNPITGLTEKVTNSPDALKIMYEDGIPIGSMIDTNMLLGNKAFANIEVQNYSRIWSIAVSTDFNDGGYGARIESEGQTEHTGRIAGAMVDANEKGITFLDKYDENNPDSNVAYLFYAGTAPATTRITFTLEPQMSSNYYINVPGNKYSTKNPDQFYNQIFIQSTSEKPLILKFTTPNFYTSYNTVVKFLNNMYNKSYTWENIKIFIKEQVRHRIIRAFAYRAIGNRVGLVTQSAAEEVLIEFSKIFFRNDGQITATFIFDSFTGEAIGTFEYYDENDTKQEIIEDVGDMLQSNPIIIQDRNYPTSAGTISGWRVNEETKNRRNAHRIWHDVDGGLIDVQIEYKNMYL